MCQPQLVDSCHHPASGKKGTARGPSQVSNDRDQRLNNDVVCSQWVNDCDYQYRVQDTVCNMAPQVTTHHDPTIHVPSRLIMRSIVTESKSRRPTPCGITSDPLCDSALPLYPVSPQAQHVERLSNGDGRLIQIYLTTRN